jgi:ribonuclease HI
VFHQRVKSLGAGLGPGAVRNASVLQKRLNDFRNRLGRFAMLSKARVCTAKVLRTGGILAMTFGEAISGVSDSILYGQRTAAARAAAPPAGYCGQDLDLALTMADASASGRADPAFDAHKVPIATWALAIWESWLHRGMLERITNDAINMLRAAKNVWAKVKGPAAAMVATAARIGWQTLNATTLVTDLGEIVDMTVDPPKVVALQVFEAVKRWRWKRLEKNHKRLAEGGTGRGPMMAPIWKLLRSKMQTDEWNAGHRSALRSAIANRQWTQARCFAARFVIHGKCLLCLDDIIKQRLPHLTDDERSIIEPTTEDIAAAPVGNLFHRLTSCPRVASNCKGKRPDLEKIFLLDPLTPGDVRIERGLVPFDKSPNPKPHAEGTFHWIVRPTTELLRGTIYPDGSWLDGPGPLARGGWAFVVVDEIGQVLAIARGVPPNWVTDIPGCEAWAVMQAAAISEPGRVAFRSDCQPCVKACKGTLKSETNAKKKHARLYNLLLPMIEDLPEDDIAWMPAHTGVKDVGVRRRGDGQPLTAIDRVSNELADKHAKLSVAEHRVPEAKRTHQEQQASIVEEVAKWVGRARFSANNQPSHPLRDTAAREPKGGNGGR